MYSWGVRLTWCDCNEIENEPLKSLFDKKKTFLFKYTSNSTKRRVKTKFKINKEAVELRKYGNHFNGKR